MSRPSNNGKHKQTSITVCGKRNVLNISSTSGPFVQPGCLQGVAPQCIKLKHANINSISLVSHPFPCPRELDAVDVRLS
eukprot:2054945-Amphidinium_carterae.1